MNHIKLPQGAPVLRKLLLALCLSLASIFVLQAQSGDWYNLDPEQDGVAGISVNRALELIEGKATLTPVIVAVIDDGVDIQHPDLEGRIWINTAESPDDGIDNDDNGYVDDVYGWNYLGNANGENVEYENLELTRILRDMKPRFEGKSADDFKGKEKKEFLRYQELQSIYDADISELDEQFGQFSQLAAMYAGAIAYAKERIGNEEISINDLLAFEADDDEERQVFDFLLMAESQGLKGDIEEGMDYFGAAINHHYNFDFEPRSVVNTQSAIAHGNAMVWAANPDHGTHVAGIIAATRNNGIGVNGIAPNAVVMPIRAVPNGDERDEDVAAAIRYAVDNGARVINMSFGKGFSPNEPLVQEAIRHAAANDVLMVHAAGNDASDNDRVSTYPDGTLGKRKSHSNWITVAASGPTADATLLADFSNYGRKKVDVMAPGVDIESLKPGEATAVNSGTSMAAPVVAGLAVLIRGLRPDLSAKEVKDIIIRTSRPYPDLDSEWDGDPVALKELLRNPAVVSALDAVQYTLDLKK